MPALRAESRREGKKDTRSYAGDGRKDMNNQQATIAKLKKEVAPYEKVDTKKSIGQIVSTIIPLFALWALAYWGLTVSYWLAIPFIIAGAGFVIRTFILFHDCCHQSFFKSRRANDVLGTVTGILTMVPYRRWKYEHTVHHATSGNLDKRGTGDMWILTIDEYMEAPWWKKFAYRFYRHPLVTFGLGPVAIFMVNYRFNRRGKVKLKERMNTYLTNIGIAAFYGALCWIVGWQAFLLIQLPIYYLAGMLGIWLFYVQHQFEDTYFEHDEEWSYVQAAVEGSSYYKLPKVLQWITGNIGFHHVHHLSPRVPNYHLEQAHIATPPLQKATTITIRTSLKALRFRLWDEENKVFISFKEYRQYKRRRAKEKAAAMSRLHAGKARPGLQGD
jgi:omega-6 fatty acid desaturase (delta-12 desaturase)